MLWTCWAAYCAPVLIEVCYRAPVNDATVVSNPNDYLVQLKRKYRNAKLILVGDFNFPGITWSSGVANPSERDFVDMCLNFNLTQVVKNPTRVSNHSSTVLDLILTTDPSKRRQLTYLPGVCDHMNIRAEFTFSLEKRKVIDKTIVLCNKEN